MQNKIKIYHEAPVSIIRDVASMTDACYCLVHLMEKNKYYKDYFLTVRDRESREILLDNSLFELGKAFDPKKYIKWIQQIRPNSFIVPDVLEDSVKTRQSFAHFTHKYKSQLDSVDAIKIGAIQGKTWQEIVNCYKFMNDNADMIAISFDFSYYQITGEGDSIEERQGTGRRRLVEQLISAGIWNKHKPHHMLGTGRPQDLAWLKNIEGIASVDTSNPVLHGLHNIQYNATYGLKYKIKTKLADLIDVKPTPDQKVIINYNIEQFRKIVNG